MKAILAALQFALKNGTAIKIAVDTFVTYKALSAAEREAAATSAVVAYLQKRGTKIDPALVALIVDFAYHHLPKSVKGS
jgi:hypothetical protein